MKHRKVWIGIAVTLAVLFVAALVVGAIWGGHGALEAGRSMMGRDVRLGGIHPFAMLGMGIRWLLMVLFWVGLIALGVWLVRALFPHIHQAPPQERELSAREILDRRFARGEITPEEYAAMKQALLDKAE
jgi:uncharacterized membrane protein